MKSDTMELMESKSIDRNEVLKRLARMKRELARKERKLERSRRAQQAKAHVKQKLREQAFLQDSGQSPSLDQTGEGSVVSTWSSLHTPTTAEYSIGSGEEREITPSLKREQKSKIPFLSRLENNSEDFLADKCTSKSVDCAKTVCFVSDEIRKGNEVHRNEIISRVGDSEKFTLCNEDSLHKKITISPDLLEVCPVLTNSRSKGNLVLENTQENSLFLTPDPTSSRSSDLNIKKILEESKKDFNDVKLKLDFEGDKLLSESTTRTNGIDNNHGCQRDTSGGSTQYSKSSLVINKKRKSTEFCDLDKRTLKRQKSDVSMEALSTTLTTAEGTQNDDQSEKHLNISQTKEEKEKKELIDKCHSKESSSDVGASQNNTDSLTVISDSVSESSQNLFPPKGFVISNSKDSYSQNSQSKTKLSLSGDKKFRAKSLTSQNSEEMKENPRRRDGDSDMEVAKPSKTESQNNSENYLDFTELDVIPFSQFQYSEYLFSSADILDSVPGKKGRRSHFGMLVQRRSPRLSSGLSNIVGDDIKSQDTDSMQSTCTSKSDNSQVLIPVLNKAKTDRKTHRKSKKGIIISSVFQFIIDEAKRVKESREFVLPFHMFNKTLQRRLTSSTPDGEIRCKNGEIKQESNSSENGKECVNSASKNSNRVLKGSEEFPKPDLKSRISIKSVKEEVSELDNIDCADSSLLKEIGYFDTSRKDFDSKSVCSTPKLKIESLTTPNCQQYCFTTPKHPPSHMSTPKSTEFFSTPLNQKRYLSETDMTLSPSLFPSQEPKAGTPTPCSPIPPRKDEPASLSSPVANKEYSLIPYCSPVTSVKDTTIPFCSPVSATKASPFGHADLPEDGTCEDKETDTLTKECLDENISRECKESEPENPLSPSLEEGRGTEERKFCTIGSFHTGRQEAVVSVLCGALHTSGTLVDFVVTLSSSSLGIWSLQDSDWMNELDWILPAGCEVSKAWLLPCDDKVVVLVSGTSVWAPVIVTVFVYDWLSGGSNKFNLPLAMSVASPIKAGTCCPLTERQIAVFYRQSNKTHGQKITLSSSFMATVDDISLESVSEPLCSVSSILNLSQAVVGLSSISTLYIWNHESGFLLQTVDVSVCCPLADSLISVHSEQGILLLTMSRSERDNPVSLVAVNPVTAASMQVMSYRKVQSWKGLKVSSLYEDFLLVIDKGCSLIVWDTNSGQLISSLPHLNSTSLDVDPSKEQIFSGQTDGCVHIYQLS